MTDYNYTFDIPFIDNDPSDDQPDLQRNTNSIANIFAEDHQGVKSDNDMGGCHLKARLICGNFPTGTKAGLATLYSSIVGIEEQVLFTPGGLGDIYQMTRAIHAQYATFATNTLYNSASPLSQRGGWTFLPGGMLFQYGFSTSNTPPNNTIVFPVPFTNVPYSINLTGTGTNFPTVQSGSVSTTQFVTTASPCYWTAIGV